MSDRSALFVRLTPEQAGRLDRAAAAVPARKKDLIGGLVERYVDPETAEGVEALREIAQSVAPPKRILGQERPVRLPAPGGLTVGHAEFRPAPTPEVLDAAQAAELLAVEPAALAGARRARRAPGPLHRGRVALLPSRPARLARRIVELCAGPRGRAAGDAHATVAPAVRSCVRGPRPRRPSVGPLPGAVSLLLGLALALLLAALRDASRDRP